MRRGWLAAVLMATLAWSVPSGAQTLESGQVRGVVYDETKAALPGATVTLTSPATGFTQTTVTNEAGVYQFAQIPRGNYEMLVELSSFAPAKVTSLVVSVGSSLTLDITMKLQSQAETVEVVGSTAAIDTSTAGVSQLINEESIRNLPLAGRDYRDLAQLSSSAQVVPGLRGGIRLGGQQSDYTGLSIDGGDARDNFFGEFFGSLETKNSTIPLEAVQEFQVVTNGFAPEFGRSSGGLLNVVTKSGTNDARGSGHYFFRGASLTADDALGTPSNIDQQHQFGASIGGPIAKDKQFYFVAFDVQRQNGPLVTKFARPVNGVAIPEYGIADMADLEGSNEQYQNLFSILGRWDLQAGANQRFSVRSFWTQNHTNGFTGGRGQNQIQASFDNTEIFENQGHNTVFTWNGAWGRKFNELKFMYSYQVRPRSPNGTNPEIQIDGVGNIGNRFFLPINGDNEKIQIQDNFQYAFGNHDMKFGGDINAYALLKNQFIGWSRGAYWFDSLESFQRRQPYAFVQGFGLNGVPYPEAGTWDPRQRQTGVGLYWQDKWQVTPSFTLTYGLRWDGTWNPPAISGTPGERVFAGVGTDSRLIAPPQETPDDFNQFGPRVGASYAFNLGGRPAVLRGAWGLYYAQTPTIFTPTGSGRTAVAFCFFNPVCVPPAGFPALWPDPLKEGDPATAALGPPGITYADPDFRNPRVSNTTATLEWSFADNWTATATYAYSHSEFLRTGGFSSTNWDRNLVPVSVDQFGRTIVQGAGFGPARLDPTIGSATALGSFSWGNFHQIALNLNRRFADRYQFFVNYSWSKSEDNASSERDTDTYFGPQDPFNIELDYGRNALDIPHQLKVAGVAELGGGFMVSGLIITRSGVPFPAYAAGDVNGDGVTNNGHSNDRPTVTTGGRSFLLERYPARQPSFFQMDVRVSKSFEIGGDGRIELLAEFFNVFGNDNLYANPDLSSTVLADLTAIPQPGDPTTSGIPYRDLNQVSPGSTAFAAQFGVKFIF